MAITPGLGQTCTHAVDDIEDAVRDKVSHELADYVTADEVQTMIAKLQTLWRQYGHRLRTLNRQGSPLYPQPGEGLAYITRQHTMTDAERDIADQPNKLQDWRREINATIKQLGAGKVPTSPSWRLSKEAKTVLDVVHGRRQAACDQAVAEAEKRFAQKPIDDVAWEEELDRRRQIESRRLIRE